MRMPASPASPAADVTASLPCVETAISVHQQGLGLGHGLLGGNRVSVRVVALLDVVVLPASEERRHRAEQTRTSGEGEGFGQALGEGGRDQVREELATGEV